MRKLYRISALGICFLLIFFDLPIVYAQSGIPSICATGTDTDQDSITNILDIDSDNDGILDEFESTTGLINVGGQPTTLNGVLINSETSLLTGDVLVIADIIIESGISIDLQLTIGMITSGATYDPASGNLFLTPYDASMDDLLEVSLVFVESGTTTPYQLQAVEMIFKDIDSQINRDFTEVIGLSGTPIAIPGSSIGPQNYENGGGLAGYATYGVLKNLNGSATDWTDEINESVTNQDHWITASYGNISSFGFTYGVTGTAGDNSGKRGTSIANIVYYISLDTDQDGVDDYLDLDADNDGIPDAIEACGDITLILEDCMLDSDANADYPDTDNNGCPDGLVSTACATAPIDTDMDGLPDYLDLDSDGDGCPDSVEAGTDALGTSDTAGYIAGIVDEFGLLTSGISGSCPVPTTTAYIDSTVNACLTCTLLTDADNYCDIISNNPTSPLASEDCDNGGIDNQTECNNGGNPNDNCDDMAPMLVCPSNQIISDKGCSISLEDYTNAISLMNACTDLSIYTFTQSPLATSNLTNGIYPITITVTDVNNNMANCTFLLEVDLVPPTVPTIFGN